MGNATSAHRAGRGSLIPEPDCQGHCGCLCLEGIGLRGSPSPFLSQLSLRKALTCNSSLL